MKQMHSFLLATLCLLCSNRVMGNAGTDSLYVNGLLEAPETYYLSDDTSVIDGFYYKASLTQGIFNLSHYWSEWGFGAGFTYSNCTDATTLDFNNLSAYSGKGQAGDSYLFVQTNEYTPAEITFNDGNSHKVLGSYITNSSYAGLTMLHGNFSARKFGGETGNTPDWFLLTITGYDNQNKVTGNVDVYLADFRFEDSSEDYILKEWQWVDLTALGEVSKIGFSMTSSDNGDFGMNTPSYFCMDGLKVEGGMFSGTEDLAEETVQGEAFYGNGALQAYGLNHSQAYLYNNNGTQVDAFSIQSEAHQQSLSLSPGIYLLKVMQNESVRSFKIVVE